MEVKAVVDTPTSKIFVDDNAASDLKNVPIAADFQSKQVIDDLTGHCEASPVASIKPSKPKSKAFTVNDLFGGKSLATPTTNGTTEDDLFASFPTTKTKQSKGRRAPAGRTISDDIFGTSFAVTSTQSKSEIKAAEKDIFEKQDTAKQETSSDKVFGKLSTRKSTDVDFPAKSPTVNKQPKTEQKISADDIFGKSAPSTNSFEENDDDLDADIDAILGCL